MFLSLTPTMVFSWTETTSACSQWQIEDGAILNKATNLYLGIEDEKLCILRRPQRWEISSVMQCGGFFLSATVMDLPIITRRQAWAVHLSFNEGLIRWMMTPFWRQVRSIIKTNQISIPRRPVRLCGSVGIILAAGSGLRFDKTMPKQHFEIGGTTLLEMCIGAMAHLDHLIIVSRPDDLDTNNRILKRSGAEHHSITINNRSDRLSSIIVGLNAAAKLGGSRMVCIHDVARPFITPEMVDRLMQMDTNLGYVQYVLPMLNGLIRMAPDCEFVSRDDYAEAVTPIRIDLDLGLFITKNLMMQTGSVEFLPFMNVMRTPFELVDGSRQRRLLRKITTPEDVL